MFSFETVIEHWNGRSWTLAHSPITDGNLNAIAVKDGTAWAVGGDGNHAIIERWTGKAWRGFLFK